MSLINPSIVYLLGLALVPVVLHLLMRSRPKKLLFPALRLLQLRRKNNVRRMRLKHIWLLLLRMAVISLLVIGLARPSLPAANYFPNLIESLTLAGIAVLALGTYQAVLYRWRKNQLPHHNLVYRRTLLRGGTGMAAFLLLLLLFVWPYQRRIAAEITAPKPAVVENLPVAAVFLFDTSLSMSYQRENKTRLEVARDVAVEQLSRLPQQSRFAVADTASESPVLFAADRSGANSWLTNLAVSSVSVPLNERLREAVAAQEEDRRQTLADQKNLPEDKRRDNAVREIYVFTDMARSAWNMGAGSFLRDELARLDWLQLYLVDVGVAQPMNVGLTALELSKQTVPVGGEFTVTATVEGVGIPNKAERTLELWADSGKEEPVKLGQKTVMLQPGTAAQAVFTVQGLTGAMVRGECRLASSDPYVADDVRHFTVALRPPPQILIVSDSRDEAVYWDTALAPPELAKLGKTRYRTQVIASSKLRESDLKPFDVVCLVNVRRPTDNDWNKLTEYVNSGGGLAVFLGMRNDGTNPVSVAYNQPLAAAMLPAELLADLSLTPPGTLDLVNLTHPILRGIDRAGGTSVLTAVDIRRFWRVEPREQAAVIARYTDPRQSPAILERSFGKGRVLLVTTAVDLRGWNDLAGAGDWPFLVLADDAMHYLGHGGREIYNYLAGDEVFVPLDPTSPLAELLLRNPQLEQTRIPVELNAAELNIHRPVKLGQYHILAADPAKQFEMGFSVNARPEESDFTPIKRDELDVLLGEKRYNVAKDIAELTVNVSFGRIGMEAFPLIVALVLAVFLLEHFVANRFYEADQAVEHA